MRKGEEGKLVGGKSSTVTFHNSGAVDQDYGAEHKAMRSRALAHHQKKEYGPAARIYSTMLERWPGDAGAWSNMGVLQRAVGNVEAAISCYHKALDLNGNWAGAWSNLGNALREIGRIEEGLDAHIRARDLSPDEPGHWHHIGLALKTLSRPAEAEKSIREALKRDPAHVNANWDLARILLLQGKYQMGWRQYHWRYKLPDMKIREFETSAWDGGNLAGKTILVYSEQGFGDTLLALRFLPLLQARGARVVLEIQKELKRLVAAMPGFDQLIEREETHPDHDCHTSLMDLPMLLGVTLDTLPEPAKIMVPADARTKIRPVIERRAATLNIGIIWSGSVTFKNNHRRAVGLERFYALAELDGVRLFSLQKGPPADALTKKFCPPLVYDLGAHFDDFADTAAAIESLDLVVMTDSSVAHLAGSMGKPVWNLLDTEAYWLYLHDRSDSPWYPSMTMYRQPTFGDWDSVFSHVREDLVKLTEQRRG